MKTINLQFSQNFNSHVWSDNNCLGCKEQDPFVTLWSLDIK